MSGVLWPSGSWLKSVGMACVGMASVGVASVALIGPTSTARAESPVTPLAAPPLSAPIPDQLGKIFVGHPQVQSARQNACEAGFSVLYGKSAYYPKLDASISGGNKLIDETTRSDEYGGRNSPEYDGKGVNATISLRQHLYDWGRIDATVAGAKSDHAAARLRARFTAN